MPEKPAPGTPSLSQIQARLQELAQRLGQSDSIDPDSRRALAELIKELNAALQASQAPPEEVARLAQTTAHLAESLHHKQHAGMLGKMRNQFEQAMIEAEAHAPVAVGFARQLLDALANLGI